MKKYTDVDIVAELQKLVDSHVDSYKEDFDIDKAMMNSEVGFGRKVLEVFEKNDG